MRLKFKPNVGASRDSKQAAAGSGGSSVATSHGARRTTSSKQPKPGGVVTSGGKDSSTSVGKESRSEERERNVPSSSDQQRLSEGEEFPPGDSRGGKTGERTRTDEREQRGAAKPTTGASKEGCTLTERGTAQEDSVRTENRLGTEAEQRHRPASPVTSDPSIGEQRTVNTGSQVDKNTVSSPSLSRDHSSTGVGRGAVGRTTRKRVAPNLAAGRGRRNQRSSEGKSSRVTAKPHTGPPLQESGEGEMTGDVVIGTGPAGSMERSTQPSASMERSTQPSTSMERSTQASTSMERSTQASTSMERSTQPSTSMERSTQPSAQTNSESRTDTASSTHPSTETSREVSGTQTDTIAPKKVTRSTSNRTLHVPGNSVSTGTLPEEESTDEMISNTLNEVLERAHSSDEFASAGSDNLSGIVRSSLDLLYPPPPLGHSDEGSMELGGDTVRLGAEEEVGGVSDVYDTSCVDGDSDIDGQSGGERDESGVEEDQSVVPDAGTGTRPNKRSSETQNTSGSNKELRAGAKRKASPSSTAEVPEAKRNFRNAPDKSTMTMRELIYYNPSSNPMGSSVEEKKRKRLQKVRAERAAVRHFFPQGQQQQQQDDAAERSSPPAVVEEEEGGRIVPQLRIGTDGNIVVDERSMVMDTTQTESAVNGSEPVLEHSGHTTSASFRKSYKVPRWTNEETTTFYKALSQVGTDFTMMTLLLPKRSRNELKNKFKKEEKKNPQRISEALENR